MHLQKYWRDGWPSERGLQLEQNTDRGAREKTMHPTLTTQSNVWLGSARPKVIDMVPINVGLWWSPSSSQAFDDYYPGYQDYTQMNLEYREVWNGSGPCYNGSQN